MSKYPKSLMGNEQISKIFGISIIKTGYNQVYEIQIKQPVGGERGGLTGMRFV